MECEIPRLCLLPLLVVVLMAIIIARLSITPTGLHAKIGEVDGQKHWNGTASCATIEAVASRSSLRELI
jgi:hypothetical protein